MKIYLFFFLLCSFIIAEHENESGVFKTAKDYMEGNIKPGKYLSSIQGMGSAKVKFEFEEGAKSFNLGEIWGYRDNDGSEFRSCPHDWGKILAKGKIYFYGSPDSYLKTKKKTGETYPDITGANVRRYWYYSKDADGKLFEVLGGPGETTLTGAPTEALKHRLEDFFKESPGTIEKMNNIIKKERTLSFYDFYQLALDYNSTVEKGTDN